MNTKNLVALALLVSSTSFGQTLKEAIQKTDNERFADADTDFRKLIAAEPANGCYQFYFGENFYERGELDSAKVHWTQALKVDQAAPLSYVGAGKTLWINGDAAGAKTQFAKATSMTKNKNAEVLRAIAETYITSETKNLDEAITLLELAIKLDPRNEDGHLLMGDALYLKTPTDGSPAIKSYNKVLEINPKSPRGIVRTAKLYQRAKNFELADQKYKEAQAIDPTYAPAYRENAELYMMFKQSEKAIANWKKYLELNNSTEARFRYATAMFVGKQYCDAITEFENVEKAGLTNFYLERMKAYSLIECTTLADGPTKGIELLNHYFTIVPSDKILYTDYKYKGTAYSKLGQDSLAILELEKASALDSKVAVDLAPEIAKLYMKAKKYDKAIEYYTLKEKSIALTPGEYLDLGKAYFVGPKNYALADSAFAKLNAVSSTYAAGFFWRARSTYQLDNNKTYAAKPYYEKVVELVKVEDRASNSYKAIFVEAAKYLGDYYVTSPAKDPVKAKEYWTMVNTVDPTDKQAKDYLGIK